MPIVSQGGGGAQLVRLPTINAAPLIHGPVTIYTPSARQGILLMVSDSGYVVPDQPFEVDLIFGALPSNQQILFSASQTSYRDIVSSYRPFTIVTATPLQVLGVTEADGIPITAPLVAWQALHNYAADALILGPDNHIWAANVGGAGGISGVTIPDFAGNEGGTVIDGTVTWTDEGAIPTMGSLQLYAQVWAAP